MTDFIRIPADARSFAQRKLVMGVGVNDSSYKVSNNGAMCPVYRTWTSMMQRCYCPKAHIEHPTYKGCSVVNSWHVFSVFCDWMDAQSHKGLCLDKDILIQGNKVYGPDKCLFVTGAINRLLLDGKSRRGSHPIGASLRKRSGRYISQCKMDGHTIRIGEFDSAELASAAYKAYKLNLIRDVALKQIEPLRSALLRWKL
jgi:hypothetical protein